MRFPFCTAILAIAALCCGQAPTATPTKRLQAIVQVQRDSIGANIVKISILDPNYSADTLRNQIEGIGKATGSGARGVQLTADLLDPKDPSSKMVRATFAVDGLVDRQGTWLKVAPIVKAFSTPSTPQVSAFQVDFDYEKPSPQDLDAFSSPDVDIQRRIVDRTIEYTISVKKPTPNGVDVPDFATAPVTKEVMMQKSPTDWFIVAIVGVAIAAGGALVYCLFLLNPLGKRRYR